MGTDFFAAPKQISKDESEAKYSFKFDDTYIVTDKKLKEIIRRVSVSGQR